MRFFSLFERLVYTITILLALACPAFQIAKMILFGMSNGILKLHSIDNAYLSLALAPILGAVAFFTCAMCCEGLASDALASTFGCGYFIAWLIVPSAYTAFTIHEMGSIPFTCPDSYNYSLPLLHTACQIRATNLIFIWAYPTFLVFSVTFFIISDEINVSKNEYPMSDTVSAVSAIAGNAENVTSGSHTLV